MGKETKRYRVSAVFDTETSNVELSRGVWRALPVAYIINDLRDVDLRTYEPDVSREHIHIWRHDSELHAFLMELMAAGHERGYIPVVVAYNLGFDLQTIIYELCKAWTVKALARSSTHIYTMDLIDPEGETVLRFWDAFHLETGGLAQMGRICNYPKALGEWDYSLIRTPETELTEEEMDYASRDVQIIPAYLRYLLDTGEVADPSDFGFRVLTKTSLVRQMARNEIGRYRVPTGSGKSSLLWLYRNRCKEELPYSFECYALRKASFRGGLTFTAARTASTVQRNVLSFDVVSMHHLYINGRRVPTGFHPTSLRNLEHAVRSVASRTLDDVLRRWECPFAQCFHAVVEFTNIRPRSGSVFERQGIGLLASGKFDAKDAEALDFEADLRAIEAENDIRFAGFRDSAIGAEFAYGKLVRAQVATIHLSEVEMWNVAQVYEWDSMRVLTGELTIKTVIPPDYVSMQSNVLYQRKNAAKRLVKLYTGEPFDGPIDDSIPAGIAERLRAGTMDPAALESWYQASVKGSFNGIYGTQAQNQLQPDFIVEEGEFVIDEASRTTPENFFERLPKQTTVWYTYGLRIVAGSRMHLIAAIMLLDRFFGDGVDVLGGDTDSLKIRADEDVSPEDILEALRPLHDAADRAISICQTRNRTLYPNAAGFESLGHFEHESTAPWHFEAWNKARAYVDGEGIPHITCAGLMRPPGTYHIENWMADMLRTHTPAEVLEKVLGYNGLVGYDVCHAREHYRPEAVDRFRWIVTDANEERSQPDTYQAIAIYPSSREIGGMMKKANQQNVRFQLTEYGRVIDTTEHIMDVEDGRAVLYTADPTGELHREW